MPENTMEPSDLSLIIVPDPTSKDIGEKRLYTVGTLSYSLPKLIAVCMFLAFGGCCFNLLAYQMIPTLLPMALDQYGASGTLIGIIVGSIPAVMNFVMNPILSTSSDRLRCRFGRRIPYVAVATPFVAIFMISLGWIPEITDLIHKSFFSGFAKETIAIVVICILSIAFQFFNLVVGSIFCYIYPDVIPHQFIGRFMAFWTLTGVLAGFIFNYYILDLAIKYSSSIYSTVTLIYVFSFVLICIFVREGKYPPPQEISSASDSLMRRTSDWIKTYFRQCFRSGFFTVLFIGTALNQASNVCRSTFNLLFATKDLQLTPDQFGKIMGIGMLVSAAVVIFVGWIMDKIHPIRVYFLSGIIVIVINILGYFWVNDYISFFVIGIGIVLVYAIQNVGLSPLFIALFPSEKYGQFCSANAMLNCVFLVIANWGGGMAIDYFGYRFIFIWDFIFTIIATVAMGYVYIKWKQYGGMKNYTPPATD